MLKDSILWLCFGGIPILFAGVADHESMQWRRFIKGQLAALVLIEFLVGAYTFNIWIELILFPLLALLTVFAAVSERDEATRIVAKFANGLLAIVGLTIVASAIYLAVSTRADFDLLATLRDLTLSPILSILVFPLAYAFALLSAYETLNFRMGIWKISDPTVARYAKRRLIKSLRLNLSRIHRYAKENANTLYGAQSCDEVRTILTNNNSTTGGTAK